MTAGLPEWFDVNSSLVFGCSDGKILCRTLMRVSQASKPSGQLPGIELASLSTRSFLLDAYEALSSPLSAMAVSCSWVRVIRALSRGNYVGGWSLLKGLLDGGLTRLGGL